MLLETQLVLGGLLQPDSSLSFSLEQGLAKGLIDSHTKQSLSELESALFLVNRRSLDDCQKNELPVASAMERGLIREEVGLRILDLQIKTGGLRNSVGIMMTLEQAEDKRLLAPGTVTKLQSRLRHRELIDPNTAEKLHLRELQQRCVFDDDSGLLLLPVKQQPGGTVCLRSGRKVGIFRAVQEGLIDRKVTVRLLEAQLFAGGIADPRSGHRLTVDEAVRHGLMDQDLACAMLARQLQNGGILDPLSGERLDLEESIRRDLLSSRLAILVLESLWAFMGILWPESGELLPIAEALQQGVISGELSRNILRQRHSIGALYNPDALQMLPLDQVAAEAMEPSLVSVLKNTHIPDVLSSMNQSGTPSLRRLSWDSSNSSSPPSSPEGISWDDAATHEMDPEEFANHKLLFHLMTHSYVDAHSGKRLVLLDPELVELVKATVLVAPESMHVSQDEPQSSLTSQLGDVTPVEMNGTVSLLDRCDGERDSNLPHKPSTSAESKITSAVKNTSNEDKDTKSQKKEMSSLDQSDKLVAPETIPSGRSPTTPADEPTATAALRPEGDLGLLKEPIPLRADEAEFEVDIKNFQDKSETDQQREPVTEAVFKHATLDDLESASSEGENAELTRLVRELKQGGLLTEEGDKLLPDEAVAQGVLPGYMALKLMAEAHLFGGFLDANSGDSLSMEDVMQEGLLDEDLMWSVLKSDKTLSGIVDVEKKQICSVREAAQAGLIDNNTAARLLEAQVASGGIVDVRRDKKVSVTLAANLGLIEEVQREELMALERAYKGRDTDSATAFTKANLQLQMEGVIDPESKSPVSLEQAIQKGLIRSEQAYQVLARQVAEGGVIHHASGMRLSVSDAVDRGLIDRSISSGLEELEWVYQGKVDPSSRPEALILQASTGAISDPQSGCKLTLTEAVSRGLLDDHDANETMASSTVTQGVLDPQTAHIVPFSELVNQGKIDIESGKRFLEVRPFRGIQDEKNKERLTLPEAVALKKVDPIPAFRLLQSQADTGGIVDIHTGERLPLFEAHQRGLVGGSMVRVIATNQFLKGGIVDPATGQQISSLDEATTRGLISSEMALAIQENLASEGNEGSATPVASSNGTYSPAAMLSASSPDSLAYWSDRNTHVPPSSAPSKAELGIPQESGKTSVESDQPLLYDAATEETEEPVSVEEKASPEPDQFIDLLSKFANNVENRIQQAIEEIVPPHDVNKAETVPQRLQTDDCKQLRNIDSVGESIQTLHTDKDSLEEGESAAFELGVKPVKVEGKESKTSRTVGYPNTNNGSLTVVTAEVKDDRESTDGSAKRSEEKKSDVGEKARRAEKEKPSVMEIKSSTDTKQPEPSLTSSSNGTQSKSKKKKRNKKNGKGKEAETQTQPQSSQVDQADAHVEVQAEVVAEVPGELGSQDKHGRSDILGQTASTVTPSGEGEAQDRKTAEEIQAAPTKLGITEPTTDPEKDAGELASSEDKESVHQIEEVKREQLTGKGEEMASVSEQPEASQEAKGRKEQQLPPKSALPDNEKAALILKAKESILKKVFGKGVSEKQTAKELQALRNEVGRKESRGQGAENQDVRDGDVERPDALLTDSEEAVSFREDMTDLQWVKDDTTAEDVSVQEDVEVKVMEASFGKEDLKNTETAPPVTTTETKPGKRGKKHKKRRPDTAEAEDEKVVDPDEVTTTKPDSNKSASGVDRQTDHQTASDVTRPSAAADEEDAERHQSSPPCFHLSSHNEELVTGVTSSGKDQSETQNAAADLPPEPLKDISDIQPTVHSAAPGTQPGQKVGKDKKKKTTLQPPEVPEPSQADQDQYVESTESTEEASAASDAATKRWEEDDDGERRAVASGEGTTSKTGKVGSDASSAGDSSGSLLKICVQSVLLFLPPQTSLIRQECLEHDQRIVALVSMVRHVEVRLKQQQQQSVGRSLVALEDIIRQAEVIRHDYRCLIRICCATLNDCNIHRLSSVHIPHLSQTLDLELRDLEPEVNKEVAAAEQLLKPKSQDVPPQLLLALEKDGRSLARGYEAARALSDGILQSLRDHQNSYKVKHVEKSFESTDQRCVLMIFNDSLRRPSQPSRRLWGDRWRVCWRGSGRQRCSWTVECLGWKKWRSQGNTAALTSSHSS